MRQAASMCGEWSSPEIINSLVVVHFKNNQLHLTKDDSGKPINGAQFYWGNTIVVDGVAVYES